MSIPAITAFLLLLTRTQPHAKTISRARLGIASYQGSMREVDWLISQGAPMTAEAVPRDDLHLDRPIAFEGVSFTYPNGGRAIDQASFTIEPGTTTALLGESGSGKTTLVNLLCRLIEPQSGEIRLGGEPIDPIDPASWRRRIAVAGQDSDLVNGTVAENIAYGRPDAAMAEIEGVARAAGADGFIAALPRGYDTPVGSQGLNLSGGQRQRIGVARALLLKPDLLIFDEATNAVDALSDMEIVRLATEHRHFQTLLIISHRKSTIAACEHGIVLRRRQGRRGRTPERTGVFSVNGWQSGRMTELIYDIGMHEGEDSKFYLLKGFRVVAVEADPELCRVAAERLGQFTATGQLTIINRAIAPERGPVTFLPQCEVGLGHRRRPMEQGQCSTRSLDLRQSRSRRSRSPTSFIGTATHST